MEKDKEKIFRKLEETKTLIGEEGFNTLHIIGTTLLGQAVKFMQKVGILEEFLEDKNDLSRMLINSLLNYEEVSEEK